MRYFISEEQKEEIMQRINLIATADAYYYIMIILACAIATYGLISNSSAVIIGAMLVSPLMGPILGCAMAITEENNKLLKSSIGALAIGAGSAIFLSVMLTLFLPVKVITPEIIARTNPTIIDLIIALTSGAAGTYAICYRPESAALPGVAISTALMPPLCVGGIGIANNNYEVAVGGFLLFLANIIAINFSSIIILKIFGFRSYYRKKEGEVKKLHLRIFGSNLTYSFLLLVLISIPLSFFMLRYFDDNKIEDILRKSIKEKLISMQIEGDVVSIDFKNEKEKCFVNAVVRSNKEISTKDIRQIENLVEYDISKPTEINMDVVLVQKINNKSSINPYREILDLEKKNNIKEDSIVEKYYTPEEIIGATLEEKLYLTKDLVIEDYSIEYRKNKGIYTINVNILSDSNIDEKLIKSIELMLEEKLKRKVVININKKSLKSNVDINKNPKEMEKNIIPLPEENNILQDIRN